MPSTFTGSGIELIADGEQSGVWGQTTNDNLQIINRLVSEAGSIALSGTTHTLTIADGSLSDGQYGVLVFGGSPSGTNTVTVSPNDAKRIFIVKNGTSESVVLTQGSGGNVTIPASAFKIVYTDGGGAGAEVVDVTSIVDINGGTIDGTTIGGASAAAGTFTTAAATTGNITTVNATTVDSTNVEVTNIKAKDGTASATIANSTGVMTVASSVLTTTDINGGTIDGTVIGGASAAAISGTTGTFSGNLTVDTNTLFVDAANDWVGIGTSSPAVPLHVAKDSGTVRLGQLQFTNFSGSYSASTDGVFIFPFSDGNTYLDNFDGGWVFRTGASTERARLDTSGTLGLNVTPSAWNSSFDGRFQFGAQGVLASTSTSSHIGLNWYYDGAYKYIGTGEASRFYQLGGEFFFENAASGTAGNAITFAERMRIDSSGNVGIGTSSPANRLVVNKGSAGTIATFTDGVNSNFVIETASLITTVGNTGGSTALAFKSANTERMRIDTSGNLLVGTTSDGSSKVYAPAAANRHGARAGAATAGYVGVWGEHSLNSSTAYAGYFFNAGSGTGLYISNTAAWQSISDARMKEDVRDLDTTERLMQLRPVDYLWKHQATSDEPDRRNLGFIAQEVQQVFPELVSTSPNGMFGVEYTGLIAPLVKAIQDQQAIIEALEARITALEA
jgi:trimeric autotransporter adhesin